MGAGGAPTAATWTVLVSDGADDRLVRAALDDHGARVVAAADTGLLAGFTSADAAVRGAVAVHRAFEWHSRSVVGAEPARIGISAADAVLDEGALRGRAVDEAKGLCAAAQPGEILCSAAVRSLAADPTADRFGEARPVGVAGSTEPVWSCAIDWARRPDEAPDLELEFRVLGPIEVVDSGDPVSVGGPKERLVLAHLLARVNTTVSMDALVDGVWAGDPPRSADRTMRSYVARLRKALATDRPDGAGRRVLRTEGRGYRLQLSPSQFDALRFEELARRGTDELRSGDPAAADTLREALGLWAGNAYAEFADLEAIAAEARRLDEMRLVALEDRIGADLAAGAGAELVAEIEGLIGEHPFRERLWGHLMVGLYRSGRQRDALDAYQRARSVLVDELGIEPGPELRRLEAAILAQDPSLDVLRPTPVTRPGGLPFALEAVGPAFVGRDTELEWLRSGWIDAVAGRGRFLSLLGPEGIGKTRLVAELAREVDAEGGVVLYGRCDHAHRGARALLDQAMRSAGGSLDRLGDAGSVDELAGTLARFLPVWSDGRAVVIVLDDLHLADGETLEVIADLAGWCAAESMLVVGAFRSDAVAPAGPLPTTGEASAQLVLRGLDRSAVGSICALYGDGEWSADDVTWLGRLTEGVPLRVHEQASEWARQKAARRAEDAADRLTGARVRLAASRVEIADSVEGIGRLLEQRRAQLTGRDETRAQPELESCPYKGLARFEAADAANFFGRERLVAELVARLPGTALLTVFGPSGSGKSSLVRAGVLPALAAGVLPGTDRWRTATMCPGAHPVRELARQLRVPDGGRTADRLLLFIDQFEETFTLCRDEAERDEFMGQLVELVDNAGTVVVIAIRADHLGRFARYPVFAELVTSDDVLVGPMRDTELRRVIELPAQRAGLALEPGLAEIIVADVAGRAGALPLLSTALAETWERRQQRTLTLDGYRAAGGVNGALARMAEDTYEALPPGPRAAARRVLLRLCDAGDDGALDLRRRLPTAEAAPAHDADARAALATMVDRRLLTVDRDSVEVAHEALLREWPRLRTWLDEDVQGRRLHRRLGDAAQSWKANDHDASELYRGTRLDGAVEWSDGHDADLNDAERSFLDASRAEAERDAADARRRIADKARTNRRLVGLLAGVGVLLVVALVAGLLFVRQRDRAEDAARTAQAGQLASEAVRAIEEDPERGILLALAAIDESRSAGEPPLPAAVGALQQAVQTSRVIVRGGDDAGFQIDASADSALLVTSSVGWATTFIWDATTGAKLRALTVPGGAVNGVRFSPQGRLVAVSYRPADDEAAAPPVILWDADTGREVSRLPGPTGDYGEAVFSPDGRFAAAALIGTPTRVTVWDVASATEAFGFDLPGDVGELAFAPDGAALVVAEPGAGRVGFHSAKDGHELTALATPDFIPFNLAFDPSGQRLALGSQETSAVEVWDLATGQRLQSIPTGDVGPLDWSPDGERLAVAGSNQAVIRIVDPASGRDVMTLAGHEGSSWDVVYLGDGARLASVGADAGGLRVWDVTPEGNPQLGALAVPPGDVWAMTFSPDGAELMVNTQGGGATVLATASGDAVASLTDQLTGWPSYQAVASPNWRLVASVNPTTGAPAVRELHSSAVVTPLPPCTNPKEFSPDSALLVLDGRTSCTVETGLPFEPQLGADLRSRVVDVATGREVLDLGERWVTGAVFNPAGEFAAGRYLVVNLKFESLEIFDMVTGERVARQEFLPNLVFGVSFDPQGRWLTGGSADGAVWILDLAALVGGATWHDAVTLDQVAHTGSIPDPRLSVDGILATRGFGDGIVRLWDVATGDLLVELRVDQDQGPSLAISPDGSYLYYADAGSVVRRLPLDTDELVELAESRLTRGFTADECTRYFGSVDCG